MTKSMIGFGRLSTISRAKKGDDLFQKKEFNNLLEMPWISYIELDIGMWWKPNSLIKWKEKAKLSSKYKEGSDRNNKLSD